MEQKEDLYRITLRVKNSSCAKPYFWDSVSLCFRATPMNPETVIPAHALRRQMELARQRVGQSVAQGGGIYSLSQVRIKPEDSEPRLLTREQAERQMSMF